MDLERVNAFGNGFLGEELIEISDLFYKLHLQSNKRVLLKDYIRSSESGLKYQQEIAMSSILSNLGRVSKFDINSIEATVYNKGDFKSIPEVMSYAASVLTNSFKEDLLGEEIEEFDIVKYLQENTWIPPISNFYEYRHNSDNTMLDYFTEESFDSLSEDLSFIFNLPEVDVEIDKVKEYIKNTLNYGTNNLISEIVEGSWTIQSTLAGQLRSYYNLMEVLVNLFITSLNLRKDHEDLSFNEFARENDLGFNFNKPAHVIDYGENFKVLFDYDSNQTNMILVPKHFNEKDYIIFDKVPIGDLQHQLYLAEEVDLMAFAQASLSLYESINGISSLPISIAKIVKLD